MAQLWDKSQKQWIKNFWLNLKNNKNAGGKNYRKNALLISVSFFSFIIAVVVRCHRHACRLFTVLIPKTDDRQIFLLFYFSIFFRHTLLIRWCVSAVCFVQRHRILFTFSVFVENNNNFFIPFEF